MNPIFKNLKHQATFEKEGYLLIDPILKENQLKIIDNLFQDYQESIQQQEGDITFSIFHPELEFKRKVSSILNEMFTVVTDKYLLNYKTILGSFAVKFSNKGIFETHKNLPLLNEQEAVSFSIWMPLQATFSANGALQVVPGSHKEHRVERRNVDLGIKQELVKNKIKTLPMHRGQMVIFDNSLIHCSDINMTKKPRISVVVQAMPMDLPIIYHDLEVKGNIVKVKCHKVDENFFFDMSTTIGEFGAPHHVYERNLADFKYPFSNSPLQFSNNVNFFKRAKSIIKKVLVAIKK